MSNALAVPYTAEDLQEVLTTPAKLRALADSPAEFQRFLNGYVQEHGIRNPDVQGSVQEQIDTAIANFAREHSAEFRKGANQQRLTAADVRAQSAIGGRYSTKSAGAKLDGKFDGLWEFLNVIDHRQDPRDPEIAEQRKLISNAMSSTDPASGGFLIPEEFRANLLSVALESAIVRPRARVIPMQSLRISMPIVDSTSNVSSVYGGVVAYWTEEAAALVQSQPAFGRLALEAKKLTAYTEVPNELRRDSAISVDTYLNEIFPEAISWFEDIAFMFGTGVGEPLGVFNSNNSAMVTQTAVGGQGTGTIVWENIVGMYARMLPSSLKNAVWVVSPAALPELFTMALSIGTGGAALGPIAGTSGTGEPTLSLLGRPIIISEKVGNLGAAGDVNLIDFSQYLIGDRMAMEAEVSPHYKFGNDMTAYRFIERVDGRPWLQSAITPRNGGSPLSAFVQLAARP